MKYIGPLLLVIIFVFISCEDITSPESFSFPTLEELQKISINQVYYDSLQIENREDMILESESIDRIILGNKDNGSFFGLETVVPTYIKTGKKFYPSFQINTKVDKEVLLYEFTLRFVMTDSSIVDVDSSALMIKYPYESAEIFMTYDEVYENADTSWLASAKVQDLDMNDTDLFIHSIGVDGVNKIEINSKEFSVLVPPYGSGDYIAYDSIYLFYDITGCWIFRYNLELDTTDLQLDLSAFNYKVLGPMDIYKNILFVMMYLEDPEQTILAQFEFDGNFIESIPYHRKTDYITIHDDIMYALNYHEDDLKFNRFSLLTKSFSDDMLSPTGVPDGIRVFDDKFYFTDYWKRFIGVIPVSDLEH